ncbi:TonB-dependent receptor [Caulobacter sp. D4A]|uniref:TonB-dependent receptor plug domain-containing protein n=1 Tax=unclassified Caulobacter TaxID=2648921 RepID=UPI000D7314ED|nr:MULTISPECIES: TonB-dependent receptor [unclassified Caulobacter]PXA90431.1 TonB-dependent receptor [Caulobacter sp. D5]PXA91627.1 TonB-dependent receptor [Caulobacter sp. D4A]
MRPVSLLALAAAVPALALPAYALADTASAVDEVIVTASRAPEKQSETAVATTVIDAAKLESAQAVIISDVLARTPGVTVTRNGGVGTTTQLRIRGAETDQTVVLIDGVKLNDPSSTGGGYNFANLLAGDVSRIEVLRGPQSTLWGSQAIGGVINMLTKTPTGDLATDVTVEGGSRDTAYGRVGVGAGGDWGGWRLAGGYYTTGGVSAFDKAYGGKEKDGYRNYGLSGRVDLKLTDWATLDLRAYYADSKADVDGFPAPAYSFADTNEYAKTKEILTYSGVRMSGFDGALESRVALAYTQTDRDNFDPDSSVPKTFDAKGTNARLEYQGTWKISETLRAVFGVESERSWFRTASPSTYDPNPTPDRHAANLDSAYLQLQAKPVAGLTLTGGLRRDDHSAFGDATTVQAGAAYTPNAGATVFRINYGEGFKAPSLYQLYSPYGLTTLKPEEAESWDVGVEHSLLDGRLRGALTWFTRDVTNQVDFDSLTYLYANIAKTKTDGVELEASFKATDRLTFGANYTDMKAQNRSAGSTYGKRLARRADETATVEADYAWANRLKTGVSVQYVGDSFDNATNTRVLKGYTLVDLRASYPVKDGFEVYGRVENLFDEDYETIYRYGSLGRGAFVGLRAKF